MIVRCDYCKKETDYLRENCQWCERDFCSEECLERHEMTDDHDDKAVRR